MVRKSGIFREFTFLKPENSQDFHSKMTVENQEIYNRQLKKYMTGQFSEQNVLNCCYCLKCRIYLR